MIDEMTQYLKPDFMTIAEDMSCNHGPMLSGELFAAVLPQRSCRLPLFFCCFGAFSDF